MKSDMKGEKHKVGSKILSVESDWCYQYTSKKFCQQNKVATNMGLSLFN